VVTAAKTAGAVLLGVLIIVVGVCVWAANELKNQIDRGRRQVNRR
jgi:hypothetical protein